MREATSEPPANLRQVAPVTRIFGFDILGSPRLCENQIIYHPQSGWFEDALLKEGTVVGGPLRGLQSHWSCYWNSANVASQSHRLWQWLCHARLVVSLACGLSESPHGATAFRLTNQRRNGRAFSSLTARGGGLPIGVSRPAHCGGGSPHHH